MSKYLQSDIAGPIATITLTRPDTRNAINPELLADLSSAIAAADDDPDISVICLRAVGPVFSAGGDLQGLRGGGGATNQAGGIGPTCTRAGAGKATACVQ